MDRNATSIDGCHPGWSNYRHCFGTIFFQVFQKSGLTSASSTSKKYISGGVGHQFESALKVFVVGINCHRLIWFFNRLGH
jgi:hypothetical protein